MNHNAAGNTQGEKWPGPENNESKRRKKRRNRRGSRQNKRANAAARVESGPDLENGSTREYSADDLSEAVVWVRDYDPNDTSIKPLINTEQYLASKRAEQKRENSNKSNSKNKPGKKVKSDKSISFNIEHIGGQDPPEEKPAAEPQRADHEPVPPPRERTYFWNQADIYQPSDRDRLPEVKSEENPVEQADASPFKTHIEESVPPLEQAVNPNDPNVFTDLVNRQEKPKTGFIARRREKRAVQSPQMEAESFVSPYAELSPKDDGKLGDAEKLPSDKLETQAEADPQIKEMEDDFVAEAESTRTYPETTTEDEGKKSETIESRPNVELSLERSEQLDLARSIQIDGVSVYEMFVARRIDEAGLHRIIIEFLRGGDLRDVIKSEIIRQQLKFERDPQLRNTPVDSGTIAKATLGFKDRTKSLIDTTRNRDRTEKMAEFTQSAIEKSQNLFNDNPKTSQRISIAAIVVIYLAILIVALAK